MFWTIIRSDKKNAITVCREAYHVNSYAAGFTDAAKILKLTEIFLDIDGLIH